MGDLNFNMDEVQLEDYKPLIGHYLLEVVSTELKDTRTGGKGLKVNFEVIDEKYGGRKVNTFFNITNSNPDAERIGRQQLKSMCLAMGFAGGTIEDTAELFGKKVIGKLDKEESKQLDAEGNPYINQVIKSYSKPEGRNANKVVTTGTSVDSDSDIPF